MNNEMCFYSLKQLLRKPYQFIVTEKNKIKKIKKQLKNIFHFILYNEGCFFNPLLVH